MPHLSANHSRPRVVDLCAFWVPLDCAAAAARAHPPQHSGRDAGIYSAVCAVGPPRSHGAEKARVCSSAELRFSMLRRKSAPFTWRRPTNQPSLVAVLLWQSGSAKAGKGTPLVTIAFHIRIRAAQRTAATGTDNTSMTMDDVSALFVISPSREGGSSPDSALLGLLLPAATTIPHAAAIR
ncbi:hypothetical protein GQ54DRAFT_110670 [Martensiomyces pterosporus]|nr:hypothetical protein GQ54DRAFT_110670 [Martensiomyces pterosporus]